LKLELHPDNPDLTPAWKNHRKKDPKRSPKKWAFNESLTRDTIKIKGKV